jgi:thioesterase domain-containing protein
VVVLHEREGNKSLAAYLTVSADADMDAAALSAELRVFLKESLPEYMVPSSFTLLEKLPLTPNGKIDRRNLPEPEVLLNTSNFIAPRNNTELLLARIWEKMFALPSVSVTADFFELGGHSLLAVRMIAQIKQQCGRDLRLTELFRHSTIEQLAVILRQEKNVPAWSPLVPVQEKGDNIPLFCVHPAGGNVLCYYELAGHLGEEQPFYGLQAFGLEDGQAPYRYPDEMAKLYLESVRKVQPQGPYQLAGWSFGGLVAFTMAAQLREQGEAVSLLALLDTPVPTERTGESEQDDAELLAVLLREEMDISAKELQLLAPDEQLEFIVRQGRKAGLFPPDVDIEQTERILKVYKINAEAAKHYRPELYKGAVTLFLAAEMSDDLSEQPSFEWEKYAAEGVQRITVPGNHQNMVKAPHVRHLADAIRPFLQETKQ